MGGRAANAAVSEFAYRPPTPDPSPPRADARGGRGEEDEFNFQTAFRYPATQSARVMPDTFALPTEGAGNAGRLVRPPPHVRKS